MHVTAGFGALASLFVVGWVLESVPWLTLKVSMNLVNLCEL